MGISGLHPVIKPFLAQCHVKEYRGCRLGVDAWSWLHRGAVGAARELATGTRPWEQRGFDPPYVTFCLRMVAVLKSAGAIPVLVFDGCRLPAKAATNAQRRQRRSEARERAQKLLEEGREAEAQGALMQCIDVTSEMAHEVIVRLRERGVEFVVAPYEADAQLAYLCSIPEHQGGLSAVVTEDSDLVGYGCRRILFKMDTGGHCLEFSLERLLAGPEAAVAASASGSAGPTSSGPSSNGTAGGSMSGAGDGGGSGKGQGKGGGPLSFRGWTLDMLQAACVLAGCDFLPSLKGISFRTAAAFVARRRSLEGALKAIQAEKRFRAAATAEYCAATAAALLNFKHALVFCPNTAGGSMRRLTPEPRAGGQQDERGAAEAEGAGLAAAAEADLSHLGVELDAEVARGIAYGYLHPHTLKPFASNGSSHGDAHSAMATQQQHSQQRGQQQHGQQQQQYHASMAGRRQLGSWVVAAAPHQAGLGPLQQAQQQGWPHQLNHRGSNHHHQLPPRPQQQQDHNRQQHYQQRHRHAQEQQQQGIDMSDVLLVYECSPQQQQQQQGQQPWSQQQQQEQQQHAAHQRPQQASPQHDQQQPPAAPHAAGAASTGRQLARNPFVRQPGGLPAAGAAAGAGNVMHMPAAAGAAVAGTGEAAEQQGHSLEAAGTQASAAVPASVPDAVMAAAAAAASEAGEVCEVGGGEASRGLSQCGSLQGPPPGGPSSSGAGSVPAQAGGARAGAQQQQQQGQRPAMQAITNLQLQQQQHRSYPVHLSGAAACAAGDNMGSAQSCKPDDPALQVQPADRQRVWDSTEQYLQLDRQLAPPRQAWATPPAATAGSKRKSSGSSGGSSGKKGARPGLAPPAQRISRFFVPAPKRQ